MSFDVPATPVEIVKVGHSALGNGTRSVTEDVGDPMLAQHLHSLMMFQRLAIANGYGWQRFLHMVDQVLPRRGGLSPLLHPAMGRVPLVFEPKGLGGATGRGVEPST